jgi:hypothetical protein
LKNYIFINNLGYIYKKYSSSKVDILWHPSKKQGGCHNVALPFKLNSILRQKKNNENSNISPCKNIVFKKSFKKTQNPSKYYNSIINFKFQHKPKKYHLSKILI